MVYDYAEETFGSFDTSKQHVGSADVNVRAFRVVQVATAEPAQKMHEKLHLERVVSRVALCVLNL